MTSPFTRSDVTTRAKRYKYVGCVKLSRTETKYTSSDASFEAELNALSFIYVAHTDQKLWTVEILDIYAWVHYTSGPFAGVVYRKDRFLS